MARTPSTQPTDGELEILKVLWSADGADLGTIRAALQRKRPVATTTIATMLKLMRDKGLVDRGDGPRGYVWSAKITRKAARAGLIGRLIDLAFEGSARGLVRAHARDGQAQRAGPAGNPAAAGRRGAEDPGEERRDPIMIGSRPALLPVWHLAGWTMLHFIWAGSLVAVLAALGRQILRRAHPDVRYAYALASLTLLAAAPAVIAAVLAAGSLGADDARSAPALEGTWLTVPPVAQSGETVSAGQSAAERSARTEPPRLLRWANVMVDILPGVWLVGAPLTFVYMAAGLWGAERLRRRSQARIRRRTVGSVRPLGRRTWSQVAMWPSACAIAWRPRSCSASRDR